MLIRNIEEVYQRRSKLMNLVALRYDSLNEMAGEFNSIWGQFNDFSDSVMSIMKYPIKLPITIGLATDDNKYSLKTPKGIFSNIRARNIKDNFYYSLGEYFISPKFNNFADYNGYTIIKVFLPYVGYVDVEPNECMGKYLQFRMFVDFYTGKALHIIGVTTNSIPYTRQPTGIRDDVIRIISMYEFQLGGEVSIGSTNMNDIRRNIALSTVKTVASVYAGMYMNALPAASSTTTTTSTRTYDVKGKSLSKGSRMKQIKAGTVTDTSSSTTVHNKPVNKLKPYTESFDSSIDVLNRNYPSTKSDRVGASTLMDICSANVGVVIYRPKFITKDEQLTEFNTLYGSPLGEVRVLGTLRGYAEVSNIQFNGIEKGTEWDNITQEEIAMLEDAFANGVILPE